MVVTGCDEYPEQKQSLMEFGKWIKADWIEYFDYGKSELYIIHKGKKSFKIQANGNHIDGGYVNISRGDNGK